MKKRILSIVIALCMMLVLLPSMASAGSGTTAVISLTEEFLDSKYDGSCYILTSDDYDCVTYELADNIELAHKICIGAYEKNANIILDLKGKTLTMSESSGDKGVINVYSNKTLVLKDTVGGGKVVGNNQVAINSTGYFTLESGTLESNSYAILATGREIILNGGTVNGEVSCFALTSSENATGTTFVDNSNVVAGVVSGVYREVVFKENKGLVYDRYATAIVLAGQKVAKPATSPTWDGYEFQGWYTAQECKEKFDFENTGIVENTNIYAGWKDVAGPVITGLEVDRAYCEATTFTVADNVEVATVGYYTVDSNDVTVLTAVDGNYTLPAGIGAVTVVAKDTSGNKSEVKVTMNHTWGDWAYDKDGQHIRYCTVEGCEAYETEACVDTDAKNHKCDACANVMSEHSYEWQSENGQYWQKCSYCGNETAKQTIPTLTINGADKVCNGDDYTFTFTLPEGMKDPTAGYDSSAGGGQLAVTASEDGTYAATVKENYYKTGYEEGETSFKVIIEAETADGYKVTVSKDVTIAEHSGGTATCIARAVCDNCGQEYGELDSNNHVGALSHVAAKAATTEAEGNTEYWYCTACNKYFANEDATIEIAQEDTVLAKLADNETAKADSDKSSQTGDDFNMTLLIALLIASCGILVATLYGRRRSTK